MKETCYENFGGPSQESDDEAALKYLKQALEGNDQDNELKAEILGAMGIIHSESESTKRQIISTEL